MKNWFSSLKDSAVFPFSDESHFLAKQYNLLTVGNLYTISGHSLVIGKVLGNNSVIQYMMALKMLSNLKFKLTSNIFEWPGLVSQFLYK